MSNLQCWAVCANACTIKNVRKCIFLLQVSEVHITFAVEKKNVG